MRQKGFWLFGVIAICLVLPAVLAASGKYKVLGSSGDLYYGHISYIDVKTEAKGPSVWREGQTSSEKAVLNLPLGPGDTIRTTPDSRCEIQFDTGTIVRLDADTELKIETILAPSLSSSQKLSNLVLSRGRLYVMYKEYDRFETFQILTANAAIKLKHKTVAMVKAPADRSTEAQVKYGKASILYGGDEKSPKKQVIGKSGRLIVLADHQAQLDTYITDTDFETWNDGVNAHFNELHKGLSALPKPLQRLPDAVFYFAQNYGDMYGEWLWDSLYGYVWRPFLNNNSRNPGWWQPYVFGSWTMTGGQMYWVPEETWGWIPYHLGIWQWDKKLGWLWLPGSLFAPAWVDWEFFSGHAVWRPWSLFDWFDGWYRPGFGYDGNSGWYYNLPYFAGVPSFTGGGPNLPINNLISRDKLKDPTKSSVPMPKELKTAYATLLAAFKRQDARVLESIKNIPKQMVFVSSSDLKASRIQDKALSFDKVPKPAMLPGQQGPTPVRRLSNPLGEAVKMFRGTGEPLTPSVRRPADSRIDPQRPAEKPVGAVSAPSRPAEATIRSADQEAKIRTPQQPPPAGTSRRLDWNPDVRIARELGVHIEYASGKNEIRCPELRLSSSDRIRSTDFVPRLTPGGISYVPSSSVGSSSAGSSASSASAGAGNTSAKGGSSGGSGGSGKIKN